jgi:hypothetical protein
MKVPKSSSVELTDLNTFELERRKDFRIPFTIIQALACEISIFHQILT